MVVRVALAYSALLQRIHDLVQALRGFVFAQTAHLRKLAGEAALLQTAGGQMRRVQALTNLFADLAQHFIALLWLARLRAWHGPAKETTQQPAKVETAGLLGAWLLIARLRTAASLRACASGASTSAYPSSTFCSAM